MAVPEPRRHRDTQENFSEKQEAEEGKAGAPKEGFVQSHGKKDTRETRFPEMKDSLPFPKEKPFFENGVLTPAATTAGEGEFLLIRWDIRFDVNLRLFGTKFRGFTFPRWIIGDR